MKTQPRATMSRRVPRVGTITVTTKWIASISAAILAAALAAIPPCDASGQPTFEFTNIIVPGGINPSALGLNSQGTVVGTYSEASDSRIGASYIDEKGKFTEIALPATISTYTQLSSINDAGTAVGTFPDLAGRWHSFLRKADGEIVYLPDAATSGSAPFTWMWHNNNHDVVVGAMGPNANLGTDGWQACVLQDGKYTLLKIPGASASNATGINDQDDVVGWFEDAAKVNVHGFLKKGDTYTNIDYPGATDTNPFGINNQGQIIGTYRHANVDTDIWHGFLFTDGVFTTVDYPGKQNNHLWSINDHSQMVGTYDNDNAAYLVTIVPTLAMIPSGPHFGFNGGKFGFDLTGPIGKTVTVEASTDLASWLPIWTNALSGPIGFNDPQSLGQARRFYRAQMK